MIVIIWCIIAFFIGDAIGIFLTLFMVSIHKNNEKEDYWNGFLEGYNKAKEEIKNENSYNRT